MYRYPGRDPAVPASSATGPLLGGVAFALFGSSVFYFHHLFLTDHFAFQQSIQEDELVENATAICLLLAGILLGLRVLAGPALSRTATLSYTLGCLGMLLGSAEEISWGQRIFDFATPRIFVDHNIQQEVNFHNIDGVAAWRYVKGLAVLLCVAAFAGHFLQKTSIAGIALPSPPLLVVFLLFCLISELILRKSFFGFGVAMLVVLTLLGRKLVPICLCALVLYYSTRYASTIRPLEYRQHFDEIAEYFFSLACVFYALEIWTCGGIVPSKWRGLGLKLGGLSEQPMMKSLAVWFKTGSTSLYTGCALVALCAVYLLVVGRSYDRLPFAAAEKVWSRVEGQEPIIRSLVDVYLVEKDLVYLKEPCGKDDRGSRPYLHIFPSDENHLVGEERSFRFRNVSDIVFRRDATHKGGRCMAVVPLPDYEVAAIRTGQLRPVWREMVYLEEKPRGQGERSRAG